MLRYAGAALMGVLVCTTPGGTVQVFVGPGPCLRVRDGGPGVSAGLTGLPHTSVRPMRRSMTRRGCVGRMVPSWRSSGAMTGLESMAWDVMMLEYWLEAQK